MGFWGEELIGPLEVLTGAGYTVEFATPTGGRPHALPPSMDSHYEDPPLGKSVTSVQMANKVTQINEPDDPRLDAPKNLTGWFPERPYGSEKEELTYPDETLLIKSIRPLIIMGDGVRVSGAQLELAELARRVCAFNQLPRAPRVRGRVCRSRDSRENCCREQAGLGERSKGGRSLRAQEQVLSTGRETKTEGTTPRLGTRAGMEADARLAAPRGAVG